ncbi:MAG: hypothetical protein JSW27_07635, partial [Phycisphaerales bacterium]
VTVSKGATSGQVLVTEKGDSLTYYDVFSYDNLVFFTTAMTPEMMLAALRAYIVEQTVLGNIDAQLQTSLLAKVDATICALDRSDTGDAKVVINDLKALISQVEAQADKKITPEVAAAIIEQANDIITAVGG